MTRKLRGAILVGLAGAMVLALHGTASAHSHLGPGMDAANKATGGGLEAAAVGTMGDTTVREPLTPVLDLPALNVDQDADGRIVMDLPGLKLVGKPKGTSAPAAPSRPKSLPKTGVNVGDLAAIGMAVLSTGGLLRRRLALALGTRA